MKKYLHILLFFLTLAANAQPDTISKEKPVIYPAWTLWIPGGTHFYSNRILEGIVFAGLETGGFAMGILLDHQLKTESTTPYYNFPMLLGMQAYNIDKCDWLINRNIAIKYGNPAYQYDPIQFNDLLKAPFQPENVFTPITGALILVAVAELCLAGTEARPRFKDIEKMYFVNHYMDRNPAMALYGATSLAVSYGAGVGEEYIFRNYCLPVLDQRHGQKKGLLFTSLLFGSAHLTNLLYSKNPDYLGTLLQVGETTILGYMMGRDVQKRGYRIGPAVAAHMWYDFTLMLGSFLIDPENNFLGVSIKFKI